MQDFNDYIPTVAKDKIWLFNSAGLFSGNVKYLFLYISQYRPDIFACYISGDQDNVDYVKGLGFRACHFTSPEGGALLKCAGVYVNEHCKEIYPDELLGTKILNLYHGVGLKQIEKKADREFLSLRIAKKHIKYNDLFSNNMCFLVTSPFMESHFKEQLDLTDDQIIRGGYPRCIYQSYYEPVSTYSHDILAEAGLPPDTKIAVYAPTFREKNPKNFLYSAISDVDKLSDTLKSKNLCLIIKLHPEISNDFYFKTLKNLSDKYNNIIFWDNRYDIYEIFNKIDLAIVDYSSMYYDFVSAGVTNFIRYIFDYEDEKHIMIYDYETHTTGQICKSFDELISSIQNYENYDDSAELSRIKDLFWSYSNAESFDNIIEQTLKFKIGEKGKLPKFYSFDVFDTLLSRKCMIPKGIFYKVMENLRRSGENFPSIFFSDYVDIRMQAEANCRELLRKTVGDFEITFNDIFIRLKDVFELSDTQIELLKTWEVEAELEDVIPLPDMLDKAERLISENETVALISDMYLPKDIIAQMIEKVSPVLAKVPLFVSSEYGVQKSTQQLYLSVYKEFSPWKFDGWVHYGDNARSDGVQAQAIGIEPVVHAIPKLNAYENGIINKCRSYDAYLLAGLLARMRTESISTKDYYTYSHISAYMVPYVAWCVRNAIEKGIKTLYFISRDGYFLKQVAEEFIKVKGLSLKVKYLYGSRRAWRIPAMINNIDNEFFTNFGNLVGVDSYDKLLSSLSISSNLFQRMFPDCGINERSNIDNDTLISLRDYFSKSKKYHDYLLDVAKKERKNVLGYLNQEIDFTEKYAFVEYWARGYTQTCLSNLLNEITGGSKECIFYYYRSILPSVGNDVRVNYSTNTNSLIPVEAIFANSPHGTVTGYKNKFGKYEPLFDRTKFDAEMFWSMGKYLTKFVNEFYSMPLTSDVISVERMFSAFAFEWYRTRQSDPAIVNSLGHLLYSEASLGTLSEFAPAFTAQIMASIKSGKPVSSFTRSVDISLARTAPPIKKEYIEFVKGGKKVVSKPVKVATPAVKSVTTSKPEKRTTVAKTRKLRLLGKLENKPEQFFADSNRMVIRIVGKTAFSPVLRPIFGRALVNLSKKMLN